MAIDLIALGDLIRDAREDKKMRQSELGDLIGRSRAFVSLLERGEIKNPKVPLLDAISKALGIPAPELFTRIGINLPDAEQGQFAWLLEQLDQPNRQRLAGIAHALLQVQMDQPQEAVR